MFGDFGRHWYQDGAGVTAKRTYGGAKAKRDKLRKEKREKREKERRAREKRASAAAAENIAVNVAPLASQKATKESAAPVGVEEEHSVPTSTLTSFHDAIRASDARGLHGTMLRLLVDAARASVADDVAAPFPERWATRKRFGVAVWMKKNSAGMVTRDKECEELRARRSDVLSHVAPFLAPIEVVAPATTAIGALTAAMASVALAPAKVAPAVAFVADGVVGLAVASVEVRTALRPAATAAAAPPPPTSEEAAEAEAAWSATWDGVRFSAAATAVEVASTAAAETKLAAKATSKCGHGKKRAPRRKRVKPATFPRRDPSGRFVAEGGMKPVFVVTNFANDDLRMEALGLIPRRDGRDGAWSYEVACARLVTELGSPNFVRTHELFDVAFDVADVAWMASAASGEEALTSLRLREFIEEPSLPLLCQSTEFCDGGDVEEWLKTHPGGLLPRTNTRGESASEAGDAQLLSLVFQMGFALFESHERIAMMHNDIKVRSAFLSFAVVACLHTSVPSPPLPSLR